MPTVPIYERRTTPAALPGPRLSGQLSGKSPVGQGLTNLGEAAHRVHLVEFDRANKSAVAAAEAKLATSENELLHHPENGALNRRGRAAFDAHDSTMSAFDALVADVDKDLTNDAQREAFRRAAATRRVGIDRQLQTHEAAERRSYYDAEDEALINNEVDAGIGGFRDPARIEASQVRAHDALRRMAARNGRGEDWVDSKLSAITDKLHGGVIDRLLANNQDLAAKDYYAQNRALVSGATAARIEKALEIGSLRGESQRQADAILAKHGELAPALAAARKITTPEVRDAVETRVKDYFATAKAAEEEQVTAAYRRAYRALNAAGGDLNRVSPADLARLDPPRHKALTEFSRHLREGTEPVTDYTLYYDLQNLASADETRQKFLQTDLLAHRHELSNRHFEELVNLQASLRSGRKVDETLDGYRTKKQVVDDAMRSVGLDPTVTDKTPRRKAEQAERLRRRVDEEVVALQTQTGKKATSADVQEIVDRLLIQGTIPGSGFLWDDTKRLFELQPGEAFEIDADSIPPTERRKIEDALRRRNMAVTPANVVAAFRLKLANKKPPAP